VENNYQKSPMGQEIKTDQERIKGYSRRSFGYGEVRDL